MRQLVLALGAALGCAGCLNPSAMTRTARKIGHTVAPAASRVAVASRRVVRAAGQVADDAALAAQVKAILMLRKGLDGRHILVSAEEGVVRLSGRVPDAAQRHLAAEAARNSAGVVGVENRLMVGKPL